MKSLPFSLTAAASLAALLFAFAAPAHAQGASSGVQEFDPQAFPGKVVDDVIVPVPSEVFSVLDKLGEPNWRAEMRPLDLPNTTDRTRLSLMFGLVIAEGFVAVQAEDKDEVQDIGHEVLDLAAALGLTKAVRPHAQAILDAADKNDWATIRREFDRTQKTVRDTMEQMKDADLSQCVSMGGWLRGTASVTSVVNKNFSADRAELLNQPMLVEHFITAIGRMAADKRQHPAVDSIGKGLRTIQQKMEGAVDGFSKAAVQDIGKTCDTLLTEVKASK
jgi:hypothetical protein